MKKLIFIILLLPLISSIQISVNYPEKVFGEQEFEFTVLLNSSNIIYDTKIDILNPEGDRISKILNEGEWKSTIYYIPKSIENEATFKLKILDYAGYAGITVKIRDSTGGTQVSEVYSIKVLPTSEFPIKNETQIEIPKGEEEIPDEEIKEETKEKTLDIIEKPIPKVESSIAEPIHLNPKNIKTKNSNEDTEKKNYSKYLIILFCLILCFLFLWDNKNEKRKKERKNQRRTNEWS